MKDPHMDYSNQNSTQDSTQLPKLDPSTEKALSFCIGNHPGIGKYIHLNKLLQLLTERGIVIATLTATPGKDAITTELLRGRRVELLNLTNQLERITKCQ